MASDTQPSPPADRLDALLRQLTRSPDPIVRQWASALLAGERAESDRNRPAEVQTGGK